MALPQKRPTIDDKAYELAKKIVSDVVSKLASKAITLGGSPGAGVIGKVYGEYAKQFFDFYLAVSRSEKYWVNFRDQHRNITRQIEETQSIILDTPVPVLQQASIGLLITALLAPSEAGRFLKQQEGLKKDIREVVGHLDGMIRTFGLMDRYCAELIRRTGTFLETAPKRNVFDRVFTHGNLGNEINSLCFASNILVEEAARLANHRNRWADLVDLPARSAGTRQALMRACEAVGR